jgi:hypothetical protein
MKIRILTSISGVGGAHRPGDEVEWSDNDDAKRLIEAGYAEAVTPTKNKKVETAKSKQAVETADI